MCTPSWPATPRRVAARLVAVTSVGVAIALYPLLKRPHPTLALGAVVAFGIGALVYYVALWRTRLVPRWLSDFGLAAVVAMELAAVLAMLSMIGLRVVV